jgi:hypothetical protein
MKAAEERTSSIMGSSSWHPDGVPLIVATGATPAAAGVALRSTRGYTPSPRWGDQRETDVIYHGLASSPWHVMDSILQSSASAEASAGKSA